MRRRPPGVHGERMNATTEQGAGGAHAGDAQAGGAQPAGSSQGTGHPDDAKPGWDGRTRSLYRPYQDRMLAGVASGIARYAGIDVLLVRIALVVLCFVGGAGLPLYAACWLLMPDEGAEQSIAADLTRGIQSWKN
jgi:phage shock protein PspC (stress-responsive transcriptional regulator)